MTDRGVTLPLIHLFVLRIALSPWETIGHLESSFAIIGFHSPRSSHCLSHSICGLLIEEKGVKRTIEYFFALDDTTDIWRNTWR
jgi:hypothetical protein